MVRVLIAAPLVAVAFYASAAGAAKVTQHHEFRFEAAAPAGLEVDNLVGDVRIEPNAAGGFEVDVEVTVEAGGEAEAEALARAVRFRQRDAGAGSSLQVLLPKDEFPQIFRRSAPGGWLGGRMYVEYLGERRRITGDADEGVRVRVDLVIRAPADGRLEVRNVLGDAVADGFRGALTLDGTVGTMRAANGSGELVLDTGSGPVEVSRHRGRVRAEAGSGTVTIDDCECDIEADTGSGSVVLRTQPAPPGA